MRRLYATKQATRRQLAAQFGLTYEGAREIVRARRRVYKGIEPEPAAT